MAEVRAEKIALMELKKAEAYVAEVRTEADNQASIIRHNANTRLQVAKDRCSALIKEAEAEAKMSNNMEGMRRHEEKIGAAEVLV